ncbi:CBS domain-containing protein [bacterium]|nr:CBS domain-containing protein [bacterium]
MHNWKNTILKQTETMQAAINVLDEEALKIIMVTDDSEKLIGTITDGDIRRALIKHMTMESKLHEFMYKHPTVISGERDRESIIKIMEDLDLLQIPVVDKGGKIIGLETLQCLIKNKKYNNPVFLMAGGFGKRLQPLTNDTPKPMLKVGSKPILATILDQFIEAGFHDFYISVHYKAEVVENYFGDGSDRSVSISYIHESKPLGTAGSLGLLPKKIINLPILIMNGDLLTKVNFEELLNFHIESGGDATMCVREYDFQVPYGVVKANDFNVTSIEEKPVHKFFVNAGMYVLNSNVVRDIDGVNFLNMTEFLEDKIKKSELVSMFPLHEYWLDIGQIEQFNQAQIDINGKSW